MFFHPVAQVILTKMLSEYDINAHFMGKEMGAVVY